MTPAKLWLRIFLAGFAVVVAMLLVTLFTPVPYGDLSRIGRVSDHEFGWRRQPPPFPPEATLRAVSIDQADIVVIGDSFSMTYMWQSDLVQAGYKVTTIYWGQYSETMCGDLQAWLQRAGFRGKLVIFESVERLLKERLKKSTACEQMSKPFASRPAPLLPALSHTPPFELNSGATLISGLITWDHTRRAKKSQGDAVFDETQVRVVPDGCAQFSHRLCNKALFFDEDVKNGELDLQDFDRMVRFNASHVTTPFIWMVIPDKTTTYLDPNHSKAFMDAFRAARLGPDLYAMTAENRMKVQDLYFPNDTHLSMHGQRILGQRMLAAVREKLPTPPARSP
ncbi:hypothetical protein [Variovorax fucosicus]|uniref:hypothetical protein n=1 Tax=Variovorax fucosicus TaxID=3053517 RepID=UPI002577BE1C|nr:hypothetical protein [Variovorax sp. J22G47]MDM0056178.1 hypothetical protein [Variovorax sp. J22G47]